MALIVSLTSIHSRLSILRYTVMSLLEQTVQADKIVLNISRQPYLMDAGIEELPEWLVQLEGTSLTVNWVENTGPYRKLLPTLSMAADEDMLVTCDDDVIYGRDWLRYLVMAAREYPDALICGRARMPVKNIFGRTQSYLNWPLVPGDFQSKDILPIGVAGVLYRKEQLVKEVINSERCQSLAPKQDDLWFNLATRLSGVSVIVVKLAGDEVYEIKTPINLSSTNASMQEMHSWDRFFLALANRLFTRMKAYMGASVCENDHAIKRINRWVKSQNLKLPGAE